jgi:drug/metabolite transporter (DMT)-like permease
VGRSSCRCRESPRYAFAALLGAWIGAHVYVGLSAQTFQRVVLGLLLASGCILLVRDLTITAAGCQVLRNAMQSELTSTLGTVGATHVRFLFGLPFALLFLVVVRITTGLPLPRANQGMLGRIVTGALAQFAATALMLAAMQRRSFVVATAYVKTEPVQVAILGLAFLGDGVTAGSALAILTATAGVLIVSGARSAQQAFSWKTAVLEIGSGALFAVAAIGYRVGIRALDYPNFVVAATATLVLGS